MKSRTFILLSVSAAMAAGAAMVANDWLEQQQPALVADDRVPVVVAAVDIPYGQTIENHHLKILRLDPDGIPQGTLTKVEDVEGKVASQNLLSDEIIHSKRIAEHQEGSTLAALITPTMRAVTIRVNDVIGVAGFLLPGNRVDVLNTRKVGKRIQSRTVLQDIKVLAVDQKARTDKNDPVVVRAVTVEVAPVEAETLMKARDEGKILLALRNPQDDEAIAQAKPKAHSHKRRTRPVASSSVTVIRGVQAKRTKVSL